MDGVDQRSHPSPHPCRRAALTVLGILCGAAFGLRVGEVRPTSLARSGSAEHGLVALQHAGFPVGVLSPIEVLVPDRTDPAALAAQLGTIHGVDTAVAPTGTAWRRSGTAIVDVLPSASTSSATDNATVSTVRATVARLAPGAQVAGDGPEQADLVHAFYSRFPFIVALVALLSLLALARAFDPWCSLSRPWSSTCSRSAPPMAHWC